MRVKITIRSLRRAGSRLATICLLAAGCALVPYALPAHAAAIVLATSAPAPDMTDAADEADEPLAEDFLALEGPELPENGFNASMLFSGLHDQQLGWAGFMQPAISWRFNHIFSADVTVPYYFYRLAYTYKNGVELNKPLTAHANEIGDTTIAGHMELHHAWLSETLTPAFNAPTGDAQYGLGTGRVTYVVMNDDEAAWRSSTFDLQLGVGDTSDLVNRRVERNYVTLGTLAYFQTGILQGVTRHLNLIADMYEQLPIGSQKVYTDVERKDKKIAVQAANSNAEDNGFTATLDIPTAWHVEFTAYGNRSFRLQDTTIGVTMTFALRSAKADFAWRQNDGQ